jgi:hypothetical protein
VENSVPELVLLVMAEPPPLLEKTLGDLEPDCTHVRSISGHATSISTIDAVGDSVSEPSAA